MEPCTHSNNSAWDCGCAWSCQHCQYTGRCNMCGTLTQGRPYIKKAVRGLSLWLGYPGEPVKVFKPQRNRGRRRR